MHISDSQIEDIAKQMFDDRETKWMMDTQASKEGWDSITEHHRQAWRDTVRDTLKFATPVFEAQFTAELEELFGGFFKGMLEARKIRNEVKAGV